MPTVESRMLVAFAAVFTVSDVGRSLDFYLRQLGFREFFRLGDPISYAIVERDAVSIHLMPASQEERGLGRSSIYVFAGDVDTLHDELRALACQSSKRQPTTSVECGRCRCAISTGTASHLDRK